MPAYDLERVSVREQLLTTDNGFTAVTGGKGGGTSKPCRMFAENLTEDRAAAPARKVIAFYRENGVAPERLGAPFERVGFYSFVKAVS